jgi:hypothetical protein
MNFSLNLLRIKGLYMFRGLLAHPQEALHERHFVYFVHIMSVGCGTVAMKLQPCHSQLTLYARNIPNAVCVAPPENEQVMLVTGRGLWFSINWMQGASLWFHYTEIAKWHTLKFRSFSTGRICERRSCKSCFRRTISWNGDILKGDTYLETLNLSDYKLGKISRLIANFHTFQAVSIWPLTAED